MMTCRYTGGYAPALSFEHAAANPALCSVLRAPLDALPALPAPALPLGLSTDARFTTSQSGLACRAHAMTRSCAAPRCSASGPPPALPSAQPPACLHPAQKHTTHTVQHATYSVQHATYDRQHTACVTQRYTAIAAPFAQRSAAEPSACLLRCASLRAAYSAATRGGRSDCARSLRDHARGAAAIARQGRLPCSTTGLRSLNVYLSTDAKSLSGSFGRPTMMRCFCRPEALERASPASPDRAFYLCVHTVSTHEPTAPVWPNNSQHWLRRRAFAPSDGRPRRSSCAITAHGSVAGLCRRLPACCMPRVCCRAAVLTDGGRFSSSAACRSSSKFKATASHRHRQGGVRICIY